MKRVAALALLVCALSSAPLMDETWTFDRLDQLGGHSTTIVGQPRVVETTHGKAVEFNGESDAIFVDVHPLAGAETFTWEVIFKPASNGHPEQRFFHLQELDPATGKDTQTRLLFETRLVEGKWFLDSFAWAGGQSRTLFNKDHLHALDSWYHVAAVYDGKEFRNYVNGQLEGSGELHMIPQGNGHSSAGVRINRRDYFKGAIRLSRFTRRVLTPDQFLKP